MALVIVLAFVVLLTGVIVAYFARAMDNRLLSASSYNQTKSDELARSALDIVVSDLEQEIVNGSTPQSGLNPTPTSPTIYIPTQPAYAIPVPNGTPPVTNGISPIPTLIRISTPTAIPTPGVDHAASKAPSTAPSGNGRTISLQRWNQHYLIPRASPAPSPADSTPVGSFTVPSWVYVTNQGPQVLAAPASTTVGRYAYAIYNEGALLDMNVAGYPSALPANTPHPSPTPANKANLFGFAGKGSVAFAELTALQDASGAALLTQQQIDDIVAWRNYATTRQSGTFPGSTFSLETAALFFDSILSNSNGFLQVNVPATPAPGPTPTPGSSNNTTDQAFMSRQQLLALQKSIGFNVDALSYLGTFSRAVNAPSWRPLANASALPGFVGGGCTYPIAYLDDEESKTTTLPTGIVNANGTAATANESNPNRDLPNVRFTTAGNITHYKDDATTITYNVNAGDPLLASRFSLARLAWLSQADPYAGTAPAGLYSQAIQDCFGLAWTKVGTTGTANGGNPCWSYVGVSTGTGVTVFDGTIKTLNQVAAEGREPNFFEMLKAAILSGSLGGNPGKAAFANDTATPYGTAYHEYLATNMAGINTYGGADNLYAYSFDHPATGAPRYPAPALVGDMQVMQIGANIIDQYDADSYPTVIYFRYKMPPNLGQLPSQYDATAGNYGTVDLVYGDENIPLLNSMVMITCTVDGKPPSTPGTGPTAGLAAWWQPELWNPHQYPNTANTSVPPPATFELKAFGVTRMHWSVGSEINTTDPERLDFPVPQTITFTDLSPLTSPFYDYPRLITNTDPTASGRLLNGSSTALSNVSTSLTQMMSNNQMVDYGLNPFVGFFIGQDDTYSGSDHEYVEILQDTEAAQAVSFWLGWVGSGGAFHPYSCLPGIFADDYCVVNNTGGHGGGNEPQGDAQPYSTQSEYHRFVDPRTSRFSSLCMYEFAPGSTFLNSSTQAGTGQVSSTKYVHSNDVMRQGAPFASNFVWTNGVYGGWDVDWGINQKSPPPGIPDATVTYYSDLDGVVRPGDGYNGNTTTFDGLQDVIVNGIPTGSPRSVTDYNNGKGSNDSHGRRPIILNRPFRSVGELGYTFRDLPFKTLDFSSPSSADAALLDVFCLSDDTQVVGNRLQSITAGQVSLNYVSPQVLQAVLMGGLEKDLDSATLSAPYSLGATDAPAIASNCTALLLNPPTGTTVPVTNRADLPALLNTAINEFTAISNATSYGNKAYREAPLRALADVTNARTWNLLIDVIAQAGVFSPSAPPTAAALNSSFIVQGESRYWLHVAIDRYTGKVVDEQLEPVYE